MRQRCVNHKTAFAPGRQTGQSEQQIKLINSLGSGLEQLDALENRLAAAEMAALSLSAPVLSASDVSAGVLWTVFLTAQEGGIARAVHADLTAPLLVQRLNLLAQVRHFALLADEYATEPGNVRTLG